MALYHWIFDLVHGSLCAAFAAAVVLFPFAWLLILWLNCTWLDPRVREKRRLRRLFVDLMPDERSMHE
jgi:hypothetical protein